MLLFVKKKLKKRKKEKKVLFWAIMCGFIFYENWTKYGIVPFNICLLYNIKIFVSKGKLQFYKYAVADLTTIITMQQSDFAVKKKKLHERIRPNNNP